MKTVFIHTGNGFGPVSSWSIAAMCVSPERAMEIMANERAKGYKVKVCPYDDEKTWPL